ncbi:hypothetical protein DL768_009789 [Monosporascus sp. mg162]|nr:hypothetical protein DL768_009789 [Monosporascus sp. mg162]
MQIITIIITITTSRSKCFPIPSRAQRAAAARARAVRAERLAAERAAAEAAAAAVEPELEPEPERESTPAPGPEPESAAPAPPVPETPARPPRQRPASGARRAVPCLGCLRSALAGRSTGECFDAAVGSRCWRCASGHTCTPVYVPPAPRELFPLLTTDRSPAVASAAAEMDRLRAAVRVLLEGGAEEEQEEEQAPPAGGPAAVRAQVLALVGQILDLLLPQVQQQQQQ